MRDAHPTTIIHVIQLHKAAIANMLISDGMFTINPKASRISGVLKNQSIHCNRIGQNAAAPWPAHHSSSDDESSSSCMAWRALDSESDLLVVVDGSWFWVDVVFVA